VAKATKDAQEKIDKAEAEAKLWRGLADDKYAALMSKIAQIKVTKAEVQNTVHNEVAANPGFYNQPIPAKGWDQWKRTREIYNDSLRPSRPASAP
jgi:hypothetical protein